VLVDATAHTLQGVRRREVKGRLGHSFDDEPMRLLLGIEGGRIGVRRRGEHHEGFRIEALPQLPEVALDAAHLGWEVIRHQQVTPHRGSQPRLGWYPIRFDRELAGAGAEAQRRDQSRPLEHAHGTRLVGVDDHRVIGLAAQEKGDDAVVAGVGPLELAAFAIDCERSRRVRAEQV
jgi:hypothetical protein